jgi:hypothetical protein
MATLGLVLKIIIFALIAIFLLVLWTLVFALFSPIRYEVFINNDDDPEYIINVNLFFIIKIKVKRQNNNTCTHIYIFGRQLKRTKKDSKAKKTYAAKPKKERNKEKISKKEIKNSQEDIRNIKRKEPDNKKPKAQSLEDRKVKIQLVEKRLVKKEKSNLDSLKEYIQNEYFTSFLKAAYKLFFATINIFKPHNFRFQVIIGCEDEAETGMLMSKILIFYPLYCKYGVIQGDYVNECFIVNLELLGKLNLFKILKELIVFIGNKDARSYIKFIMNRRKEE